MHQSRITAPLLILVVVATLGGDVVTGASPISFDIPPQRASSIDEDVHSLGLVTSSMDISAILANHYHYHNPTHSLRNYPSQLDTLAYVTPWNGRGYEIAKRVAHKFTMISPVWYQVKVLYNHKKQFSCEITGQHDVDEGWMRALRRPLPGHENERVPLILPRFIIEASADAMVLLATNKKVQSSIINKITDECTRVSLDGIVLEMTEAWSVVQQAKPSARSKLNEFVNTLGKALHGMSPARQLILVVRPAMKHSTWFHYDDLKQVAAHVDRFSLMTYDFAQRGAGPSAPLQWVEHSIKDFLRDLAADPTIAAKVLMGLNFYGMDWPVSTDGNAASNGNEQPRAILGHEYIDALQKYGAYSNIEWNDEWHEHIIQYMESKPGTGTSGKGHVMVYPSLQFIHDRLQLAQKYGVGVSIWEIGQGLDYFTDLL